MTRPRIVCPLTAPMAQDVAVSMAAEAGKDIDVVTAQRILTEHTSWPLGTEATVKGQLRRHLSGAGR